MIRTIIVDDEPLARERIRDLLGAHADIAVLAECRDGLEAVAAIDRLRPDAALLDIQMPGLDAFDVLAVTEHAPAVVFVTAYDEHALRAFDSHAVDYVLKPIDAARFTRALERLRARLGGAAAAAADAQLAAAELGRQRGWSTRIAVRAGGGIELVAVGDLDWIEAVGNYVCLHAGARELILRSTLKALELRLDPDAFVRIHRGAIVNIERVQRLAPCGHGEYVVTLRGGATLTATRSFSHRLRSRVNPSFLLR